MKETTFEEFISETNNIQKTLRAKEKLTVNINGERFELNKNHIVNENLDNKSFDNIPEYDINEEFTFTSVAEIFGFLSMVEYRLGYFKINKYKETKNEIKINQIEALEKLHNEVTKDVEEIFQLTREKIQDIKISEKKEKYYLKIYEDCIELNKKRNKGIKNIKKKMNELEKNEKSKKEINEILEVLEENEIDRIIQYTKELQNLAKLLKQALKSKEINGENIIIKKIIKESKLKSKLTFVHDRDLIDLQDKCNELM